MLWEALIRPEMIKNVEFNGVTTRVFSLNKVDAICNAFTDKYSECK